MRRLFLPVLLFVLFTVFSARAGQPSYSADVTVDVTADNASAARELAMRRANRQAVSAIAANFTTREGVTVLNKLTDDQLLNFIRETTVLEEKTSNVRYLAKLRITANDKILRQYLQEKNVPLVVASSAEVMVIPVFREGSGHAGSAVGNGKSLARRLAAESADRRLGPVLYADGRRGAVSDLRRTGARA